MHTRTRHYAWLICLLLLTVPAVAAANTFEGNAQDVDGDGVANREDRDSDNDGILDVLECGSDVGCDDLDGDGVPNHLDLDSDGDGITDAHEAFGEDADGDGRWDGFVDQNRDGADDSTVETGIQPLDSDDDGVPDFLDLDSDDDGIADAVEGHDADGDGLADVVAKGVDLDRDGLDDVFDAHCIRVDLCRDGTTMSGKPAPTPDHDGDGVEDFRQPNDTTNPDAGPDAGSDAGPDVGPDVGTDAGPDAGADAGSDAGSDIGLDGEDAHGLVDADDEHHQDDQQDELYVDGGGCSSTPAGPAASLWTCLLGIFVIRRRRR